MIPSVDLIPHEVGVGLAALTLEPQRWINRRVEQVAYLDQQSVRRHITVDFDVPPVELLPCADDEDVGYLPIAEFAKSRLVHFDFRTGSGESIPMLTAEQNSRLSSALLLALARSEAEELMDVVAERHIARLVGASVESEQALAWRRIFPPTVPLDVYRERWPALLTAADNLSRNFIIYLPAYRQDVGERRIVKMTFDSPRPAVDIQGVPARLGWRDVADSFRLPFAGYCSSYHFELAAPPGMEITRGKFLATRNGDTVGDSLDAPTRRAHFNLSNLDQGDGLVMVALRARSRDLLGGLALLALLNASALSFVLLRLRPFSHDHGADAAVTALVALPGLSIGYLARPAEHEMLASFLAGLRYVALVSGLTSLAAALTLFAGYPEHTLRAILWVLVALAFASACALGGSWAAGRDRGRSSNAGATVIS